MKFKTVLFGHAIGIEPAIGRYTVMLETLGFSEQHDRHTLFGARLLAKQLASERRNGWAERAIAMVYDKRSGKPVCGYKSGLVHREVTKYVKF